MSQNNIYISSEGWATKITINASKQLVWYRLTDFDAYKNWNPFVLEAHTTFKVGSKILFLENLQDFGQHWITAKFLSIQEPDEFVWQGHIYAPWLFKVRHSFKLQSISAAQTLFIHSHKHSGLLLPYLSHRGVFQRSQQGYLLFNQALKDLCEA